VNRRVQGICLAILALAAVHTRAEAPPRFALPLDCAPGASCWIANHVDLDPGDGARDYACGALTYDGHRGTDFALRDLRAMQAGVAVLAAAAGVVAAVRDGEPDVSVRERGVGALSGKDCGNGVRMQHAGGWQTQYCHLRRGSIAVKPGARVAAGHVLGMVGLSGKTEYPHLHFGVRRGARVVDPFRGDGDAQGCGPGAAAMWAAATLAALPYAPGSIYNYGVASALPQAREVRSGALRSRAIAPDASVFAVWAEVFGVQPGDTLELVVEAPGGARLIERRERIAKRHARILRSVGRKRRSTPWPTGEYRVTIALRRAAGGHHGASSVRFVALVR